MLEFMTMIELGALLGAVSWAHSFSIALNNAKVDDATGWIGSYVIAPVLGGAWGAVIAMIIHFAASLVLKIFGVV